ncbi:hypothetical protein D0466_16705 [Peribacillus glennii]|uniref:Uncharacterized protein n=1 Tax=Peribacillus glennii TaxID=2303991 RepID=A0A372L9I7_9BACI|nr:hypothetical protein D0466_16705 [Peribacillus glennii]
MVFMPNKRRNLFAWMSRAVYFRKYSTFRDESINTSTQAFNEIRKATDGVTQQTEQVADANFRE